MLQIIKINSCNESKSIKFSLAGYFVFLDNPGDWGGG